MSAYTNGYNINNIDENNVTIRIRSAIESGLNTENSDFHKHKVYDIYLQLEKSINYYIEDKTYTLVPGDMLLINSKELHKMPNTKDMNFRRIIMFFDPSIIQAINQDACDLLTAFEHRVGENNLIHLNPEQVEQFTKWSEEISGYNSSNPFGADHLCLSVLIKALIFINELYINTYGDATTQMDDRVQRICKYIEEKTPHVRSIDDLTARFGISRSYLSKLFKAETGMTVYQFITKEKIRSAISLLSSGFSGSVAAELCGFCDYTAFYKTFRKMTGKSPSDYKSTTNAIKDHTLELKYYIQT